jgi:hypothetical protein
VVGSWPSSLEPLSLAETTPLVSLPSSWSWFFVA